LKPYYNQIAILQSGNERFSSQVNFIDEELRDTRNALNFYQNQAAYKLVTLKGSDKAPGASMLIAFNPDEEEVMINYCGVDSIEEEVMSNICCNSYFPYIHNNQY